MDRPVEFSQSTFSGRHVAVCESRACVYVNMGLRERPSPSRASPVTIGRSSSFVFVYGHVENRIYSRMRERPSFPREEKLRGN